MRVEVRVKVAAACLAVIGAILYRWYTRVNKLMGLKLPPKVVPLLVDTFAKGGKLSLWEKINVTYPKVVFEEGNVAVIELKGGVRLLLDTANSDVSPAVLAAVTVSPAPSTLLASDVYLACLPLLLYSPPTTPITSPNHAAHILKGKKIALLGLGSGVVYRSLSKIADATIIEPCQGVVHAASKHFLLPSKLPSIATPGKLESWRPDGHYDIIITDLTRTHLNSNTAYLKMLRSHADYVIGVAVHPFVRSGDASLVTDVHAWAEAFPSLVAIKTENKYCRVIVASSSPSKPISKMHLTSPEVKAKFKSLIATLQLRAGTDVELQDVDVSEFSM
eukprot:TRINITY_DN907_c0_g1_i5.p1 TRINITY_DN907_c0_g1~~TRINITY_DN907_c0_g1_i5.p1  ORF type:complete len:333 (+),score=66.03 TRINITY_DN907_c0_g1_i5:47-1045(+)